MTRKIKTNKNEKKIVNNLYEFYLNSLDKSFIQSLTKEKLNMIYKEIELYNKNKFRYLAFDSIILSIAKIEEYLNDNTAFNENIGFKAYLDLATTFVEEVSFNFNSTVLTQNILEILSNNLFSWIIENKLNKNHISLNLMNHNIYTIKSYEIYLKETSFFKEKMVLLTLKNKKNESIEYTEIREIDFKFLQNISKVLNIMNIIAKNNFIPKKDKIFLEKYQLCINSLEKIINYIYSKEVLSIIYKEIPKDILKYLEKIA